MKDYQAKNIRNIAVVGHGSEGKTTLVEALLYTSGTIDRQGRVEDGNTVTDSDKEEQGRQISISAAVAPLEWKDVKVNLIDVPGYFDFAGEMVGPMAVAEGAIITVGAVSGLNVGAEKAWDLCDKTHTSRMIVINQMDRENANFSRALATITDKYGSHIAPIEVPIMEGGKFTGVVCVLENKAYTGEGKTLKEIEIPASMAGDVESAREAIMEAAAGAEDELMEKYLNGEELSHEELMTGIRKATIADEGRQRQAALLAFSAFPELKHVFLVDDDVDPFDMSDVLWAMTTRYQGNLDTVFLPGVRGHVLDPTQSPLYDARIPARGVGCKAIFDCTVPFDQKERFQRAPFMEVDPGKFLI